MRKKVMPKTILVNIVANDDARLSEAAQQMTHMKARK